MKKVIAWVLILSAITPFIFAPNLITYAIGGKVVFLRTLAFAFLALITCVVLFGKKDSQAGILSKISESFRKPLFLAVVANILLLSLSTIFAYDKISAFFGEPFRAEGFLTIFAIVVIGLGMAIVFEKKDWRKYFIFTWLASLVIFGFEIKEVLQGAVRPDSLLGNPIFLATYFLFSLFSAGYVYYLGRKEKKSIFIYAGIISVVLFLIGIFLTNTRGTILALVFAVLVSLILAIIYGKNTALGKKSLRFWSLLALVAIVLFSGIFFGTRKADFWQKIPGFDRLATTSLSEGTAASRIKFTQTAVKGFFADSNAKSLMLGYGWDNYVYFFQDHYNPEIYRFEDKLSDRAHNKLVDVLVMTGILGLLSYLAIWFYLFRGSLKIMKRELPIGLLLFFFLTAFFVNNLFAFDVAVSYLALYSVIAFVIFKNYNSHEASENKNFNK